MKTLVFCHFSTRSSNLTRETWREQLELAGGEREAPAAQMIPERNLVGPRKRIEKREDEVESEACLVKDQVRLRGGRELSATLCPQIHQGEGGGGVGMTLVV